MTGNGRDARRGVPLARVLAIGAPVVGVIALVLGVVGIVDGKSIGYVLVVLGLALLTVGYSWIRILRRLRDRTR
jgi:hypothetical protein